MCKHATDVACRLSGLIKGMKKDVQHVISLVCRVSGMIKIIKNERVLTEDERLTVTSVFHDFNTNENREDISQVVNIKATDRKLNLILCCLF
jgi:hypothetical protein